MTIYDRDAVVSLRVEIDRNIQTATVPLLQGRGHTQVQFVETSQMWTNTGPGPGRYVTVRIEVTELALADPGQWRELQYERRIAELERELATLTRKLGHAELRIRELKRTLADADQTALTRVSDADLWQALAARHDWTTLMTQAMDQFQQTVQEGGTT